VCKRKEMMIRNLKRLIVALSALGVIAGLTAAPSLAQQAKLTSTGPVTYDVTEKGTNAFTAFGGTTECAGSSATGHKYNVTPHELVPLGATTYTGTPHISEANCKVVEGGTTHKVTVTTNGCDSVIHLGETTGKANEYSGTGDLVCPEGKKVEAEVYAFAGSELGGVQCILKSGSQTGVPGSLTAVNTGAGDIEISGTLTGLKVEKSGSACATETTTTAVSHINVTLKGTNASGQATNISVSE
jgi:hypothetical protein